MTNDTRRAMTILKPLMDELAVRMSATDKMLFLNGDAIGISCNSTYATVMEAIGWLFLKKYIGGFRGFSFEEIGEVPELVSRYFINREVLKKIGITEGEMLDG